jgi:hypothetical protein
MFGELLTGRSAPAQDIGYSPRSEVVLKRPATPTYPMLAGQAGA